MALLALWHHGAVAEAVPGSGFGVAGGHTSLNATPMPLGPDNGAAPPQRRRLLNGGCHYDNFRKKTICASDLNEQRIAAKEEQAAELAAIKEQQASIAAVEAAANPGAAPGRGRIPHQARGPWCTRSCSTARA